MKKPSFRCSSLPRIFGCNGSIQTVPRVKERQGDEGWEGTWVHHAVASRAIAELGAIGPEGGLPPPEVPEGYTLPANATWMIDWLFRRLVEAVPAGWSLQVEVELEYEFDQWILTGHQDWLAISPDGTQAKGGDYKTGSKAVEPAISNEQMNGYLVLDVLTWPSIEHIEIEVDQPRADEDSGVERVSVVTLEGEALARAASVLDQRMLAAMANDMELNTGPVQCAYCIGCSCPAIRALPKFMKMKLDAGMLEQIKSEPDDAMLADFVVEAKTIEKAIEDARDAVIERIKSQGDGGYIHSNEGVRVGVKTQGGKFTVVNPQGAWDAVNEIVPLARMPEVVSYSKTKLVDVIAEVRGIPKSSKNKECGESVFKGYIATHFEQSSKNIITFQ